MGYVDGQGEYGYVRSRPIRLSDTYGLCSPCPCSVGECQIQWVDDPASAFSNFQNIQIGIMTSAGGQDFGSMIPFLGLVTDISDNNRIGPGAVGGDKIIEDYVFNSLKGILIAMGMNAALRGRFPGPATDGLVQHAGQSLRLVASTGFQYKMRVCKDSRACRGNRFDGDWGPRIRSLGIRNVRVDLTSAVDLNFSMQDFLAGSSNAEADTTRPRMKNAIDELIRRLQAGGEPYLNPDGSFNVHRVRQALQREAARHILDRHPECNSMRAGTIFGGSPGALPQPIPNKVFPAIPKREDNE